MAEVQANGMERGHQRAGVESRSRGLPTIAAGNVQRNVSVNIELSKNQYLDLVFSISKINETDAAIATKKRTNTQLDGRIRSVNLHVTELNLARNIDRETRISKDKEKR